MEDDLSISQRWMHFSSNLFHKQKFNFHQKVISDSIVIVKEDNTSVVMIGVFLNFA